MNRIRLLTDQVANQIAAGEVVERPASVVKELVENALDAQSTRISVEVQAGGRSLIRVTDDGIGMSRDDALLCFERHATSKIRVASDLDAISTMGFRGEAMPSIASVSRLTLTTRERADGVTDATQVIIDGGKLREVRAASGPPGTSIEARQLFFNLPARRKFLRSEETERTHIQHYLTLAALAFPEVGFTFTHDQRLVWQLPPVSSEPSAEGRSNALRERLRGLYGSELNLLPLDYTGDAAVPERSDVETEESSPEDATRTRVRVWGFIGAPGVSRATRDEQHLFVNRRPIENRGLNFALLEGYHTSLMKGRYPVCCLFIELDPSQVDVNIHPAKREVRFRAEKAVRGVVTQAVRKTLLGIHRGEVRAAANPPSLPAPSTIPPAPPAPKPPELDLKTDRFVKPVIDWPTRPPAPPAGAPGRPAVQAQPPPPQTPVTLPAPFPSSELPPQAPQLSPAPPLLEVPLRLLGVIGRLYVVFESDRGMVLMDQHAAHERVLFEQMLKRMEQTAAPCQRLLLPETVELSPRDALFLREQLPALARLGVNLSEFGERTFLLDGLPPFVRVADGRAFVLSLVDELKAAGQEVNSMRLGEHMVAKTVCRHAVKANDPLAGPELENLVEDLRRCAMPYTCPHGRPTIIEMNFRELERKFGRSQ